MADITKPELVQWYHATLFSLVKQTLIQAIKQGYIATWPYLTIDLTNKHLPQSMSTAKVHIHQTWNNLKSTKTQELKKPKEELMRTLVQLTNTVFTKIIDHRRQIATTWQENPQSHQIGDTSIYLFYMIMTSISYSSDQWSQEQTAISSKSSQTSMRPYSPGRSIQHT